MVQRPFHSPRQGLLVIVGQRLQRQEHSTGLARWARVPSKKKKKVTRIFFSKFALLTSDNRTSVFLLDTSNSHSLCSRDLRAFEQGVEREEQGLVEFFELVAHLIPVGGRVRHPQDHFEPEVRCK